MRTIVGVAAFLILLWSACSAMEVDTGPGREAPFAGVFSASAPAEMRVATGFIAAFRVGSDTLFTRITGEGYLSGEWFTVSDLGNPDSLMMVVIKADGVMACSLRVADFAGFPGYHYGTTAYLADAGVDDHAVGRSMLNTYASFFARHVIPYDDSVKVRFCGGASGTTSIAGGVSYSVGDVSGWGVWRNWHGQVVKDSLRASGATTVFDSGTGKAGVYVGFAMHCYASAATQTGMPGRILDFIYGATDTVKTLTGADCVCMDASLFGAARANANGWYAGHYLRRVATVCSYGLYRWFMLRPIAFLDRLRLYSEGGGAATVGTVRTVSFYYTED